MVNGILVDMRKRQKRDAEQLALRITGSAVNEMSQVYTSGPVPKMCSRCENYRFDFPDKSSRLRKDFCLYCHRELCTTREKSKRARDKRMADGYAPEQISSDSAPTEQDVMVDSVENLHKRQKRDMKRLSEYVLSTHSEDRSVLNSFIDPTRISTKYQWDLADKIVTEMYPEPDQEELL